MLIKKIAKRILPREMHRFLSEQVQPSRYRNLYKTIKEIEPRTILEVGTWNGERAAKMIRVAQKYQSEIKYYGFDLFEDLTPEKFLEERSKRPPSEREVYEFLQRTGATIKLYRGDTVQTLPRAVREISKVDFVYIDGGHSLNTIQHDWENVEKLMHTGTVVIFDDYWRNRTDAGCKSLIDSLDEEKFFVSILPDINVFKNKEFGTLEISYAKVKLR